MSEARALRDREGIGSVFALNGTGDAAAPIRKAGFGVIGASHLGSVLAAEAPDILILDGPAGPSRGMLEKLKRQVAVTAVIDDGHERRLAADFAYYPAVPGAKTLDWSGSNCITRIGWEWSLLGLNPHTSPPRAQNARPTLLVAMGGSDPLGLTERAAQALSGLCSTFRIRFVIGAGMADREQVVARITACRRNYETVEGADDLSTEYANADLALCAFGVTAYELAAHGVPTIYLGLTEDHARSASAFAEAGMGLSLGVAEHLANVDILNAVQTLMYNASTRRRMHNIGLSLIDAAIPSPLPGVKPGLANIVTLVVLVRHGWATAAWVTALRVVVGSLLVGQLFAPGFFLSATGAVASLLTLGALHRFFGWPSRWFGPVSLSILAAIAHLAGQLLVARLWLIPHDGLYLLVPVLAIPSLLFGTTNGLIAAHLLHLPLPAAPATRR